MKGSGYPHLHHRGHGGLISDDTPDSVTEVGNIEVDEQAELMVTQFQVRQNLRKMERKQFLHCFEFNDDAILDNEVDAISRIELDVVIDDRKSHLMCEGDAIFGELIAEARIVCALKATSSKGGVHFESGSENPLRDRSVQAQSISSVSSVSSVVASVPVQAPVL